MTKRVCPTPGCPTLVDSGSCTRCSRTKDKARGTRQERGYDAVHDKLRADLQRSLDAGQVIYCWRCRLKGVLTKIDPTNWHLGHDDQDRTTYRGPECPPCSLASRSKDRSGGGGHPQ